MACAPAPVDRGPADPFHSASGKLYLIVYADTTQPEAFSKARQRLKDLPMMLRRGVDAPVTSSSVRTEAIRKFAKEDYLKAVARAHEYVMAGDLMQVQIGQSLAGDDRTAGTAHIDDDEAEGAAFEASRQLGKPLLRLLFRAQAGDSALILKRYERDEIAPRGAALKSVGPSAAICA